MVSLRIRSRYGSIPCLQIQWSFLVSISISYFVSPSVLSFSLLNLFLHIDTLSLFINAEEIKKVVKVSLFNHPLFYWTQFNPRTKLIPMVEGLYTKQIPQKTYLEGILGTCRYIQCRNCRVVQFIGSMQWHN